MTDQMNEEVSVMCNLSQGILEKGMEKGMEKGIEKGMENALRNLMYNLKMTAEQAMAALSIPQNEYEKYKAILRESPKA